MSCIKSMLLTLELRDPSFKEIRIKGICWSNLLMQSILHYCVLQYYQKYSYLFSFKYVYYYWNTYNILAILLKRRQKSLNKSSNKVYEMDFYLSKRVMNPIPYHQKVKSYKKSKYSSTISHQRFKRIWLYFLLNINRIYTKSYVHINNCVVVVICEGYWFTLKLKQN